MKKSEKIISALLLMVLGVLFIVLQDNFIGILMTVVGVGVMICGVVDIVDRCVPPATVKLAAGLLLIICGWAVVEAVLYIFSAFLLVLGILLLYAKLKRRESCPTVWQSMLAYATPVICIAMGILLLFHNTVIFGFVFAACGILTIAEGGIFLFYSFHQE